MNCRELWQSVLGLWPALAGPQPLKNIPAEVNDIHSGLNASRLNRVEAVTSTDQLANVLRSASQNGKSVSIAGGRHAMGGQQFGSDTVLVDTVKMDRVLSFDAGKGLVEVEAGIEWPALIDYLVRAAENGNPGRGIRQKQTGADRLTIGGALSANAHGRGLRMRPFVGDVESFVLVDGEGKVHHCSRRENAELFKLAIGGYGAWRGLAQETVRGRGRVLLLGGGRGQGAPWQPPRERGTIQAGDGRLRSIWRHLVGPPAPRCPPQNRARGRSDPHR